MSGILAAILGATGEVGEQTLLSTTDKSPDYTVTSSGLEAYRSAAGNNWRMGRATVGRAEGKHYFEARPRSNSTAGYLFVGVANANAPLTNFLNADLNGVGYLNSGDVRVGNNTTAAVAQPWTLTTQTVRVAIDLDANRVWAGVVGQDWNGSGGADPATGSGGLQLPSGLTTGGPLVFPAYSIYQNGLGLIFNFGASAFAGEVPAGFSAWNG